MRKSAFALFISFFTLSACDILEQAGQTLSIPTEAEMADGLRQALEVGTGDAVSFLNTEGGYLNYPRFKIPFPPDVQRVAQKARDLGFGDKVDEFIERMNRGAEDAAAEAKPIFVNAVKAMTIADAKGILLGEDNSATLYFKGKTSQQLYSAFSPKIKLSLDKFEATKYWTDITTLYNKVPGVQKVNTDLVAYATNKALDGLFLKLSEEEKEIRDNVSARTTPLLQKVFGWAATQQAGQ
ncbi:MAG: DUF4197 domain-containing protein [Bacteroidota bacterium]|nr:DUF4197 domain-containing protein [Bacteroidota bacterium]